jgi:hypothetical protein
MLEARHDRAWHDVVTLDESWFYLSPDHEFISLKRHLVRQLTIGCRDFESESGQR